MSALDIANDSVRGNQLSAIRVLEDNYKPIMEACTQETTDKYIPHKDKKAFAADLKSVYGAVNEESGMNNLIFMKDK